jgi:hypothetical protein
MSSTPYSLTPRPAAPRASSTLPERLRTPRGRGVILDEALSEHPERAGRRVDDLMDLRALRDLQSQGQLP